MIKHRIAIVDDHQLVSDSLKKLIDSFGDFDVIGQFLNGKELIDHLDSASVFPDLILLDINMPKMNGKETIKYLSQHYQDLKVLVLSMENEEESILYMLRHGAKGYILKDTGPLVFNEALKEVIYKGFYHSELVNEVLLKSLKNPKSNNNIFSDREIQFLKLVCSEKTYKEIATEMILSPKTIDGYRESLFKKVGVKSRVGLVMYALKHNLVQVE